MATLQVYLD